MSIFRILYERATGFFHRFRRELPWFWKYALLSRFHVRKTKNRKVIMLRLDLIGDCTMFTSTAKAIREFYADREMTIVCISSSRAVFEKLGCFDRIICVDFKPYLINYQKLHELIENLRLETYDLLLQPQVSACPLADILSAAIRCNKRISIKKKSDNSSPSWVRMVSFLYDKFVPYSADIVSEFDYYGAFARGIIGPEYRTTRPSLSYSEQHYIRGKYYVLYPGASLSQKMWPADRFAKIAMHIYHETGLTGVILGACEEKYIADRLKSYLNLSTSIAMVDLMGKTSMNDVIDIIGNAELVVSNDTSGVHIACATNTPSVANVGGWLFGRFLPYHIEDVQPDDHLPLVAYTRMPCYDCLWKFEIVGPRNPECLHRLQSGKPSECIENITYEKICDLVDQIIRENNL